MTRYLSYLFLSTLLQVFAWVVTPILPAFAVLRLGKIANANSAAVEPRLPLWLAWFDTPDNSLLGDNAWKASHDGKYWSQVAWLYRNSIYGAKWSVFSAPMDAAARVIDGDVTINRNNGHYGTLRIKMGDYWQYKLVKPISSTGYCWMLNFGWLLDDASQKKALFLVSPRLVKVKNG